MKIKNKIKNLQHTVFNINKHSIVTNFNDGANCTIRFLIKRNIGQFCYSLHTTWRQENQTHAVIYQALPKLKDRNERLNERNHWVQLREWKAVSCLHGNQAQWFQWESVRREDVYMGIRHIGFSELQLEMFIRRIRPKLVFFLLIWESQ